VISEQELLIAIRFAIHQDSFAILFSNQADAFVAAAAIQGNPNFQFLILESFQLSYELANGLAASYPNRLSGHLASS